MIVIRARNVHTMLPKLMAEFKVHGVEDTSRNGPVLRLPEPTTLVYEKPMERVVFWWERDANPFLHFFESLWMLAGRNDVEYLARMVGRFRNYSDDGVTFNGAYGHRWRNWFGYDQLETCIRQLREDPKSRRVVLGMWDPSHDLVVNSKDLPCNTQVVFSINEGALNMTVYNRSNDAVWGATGANAVHFSYLQEYIAVRLNLPMGKYWQVSNNMHLYTDVHKELMEEMAAKVVDEDDISFNPYAGSLVCPVMLGNASALIQELPLFLNNGGAIGIRSRFLRRVAVPMRLAYDRYRDNESPGDRFSEAANLLGDVEAIDWAKAAYEWIARRSKNNRRAQDDGVKYE